MNLRTPFHFLFSKYYNLLEIRSFNISCVYSNKANTTAQDDRTTHFGFKTIKQSEKTKEVYSVFENVANSYDAMNDAMSFGIHRIWKDIFIEKLDPEQDCRLLDCAGGTGDIAFRYLKHFEKPHVVNSLKSHVTVLDINANMLDVGQVRAKKQGFTVENGYDISWVQGNAENLPCDNESYTAYTIAFGIRNVTDIDKALSEAYRILKPGGRFLCLEFSHVDNFLLRWVYDQYSFQIIPVLGTLIAGQWQPYQYLVESIRRFPKQEKFREMILNAGFKQVTYENLTFGTVAIHKGYKI
ncbi:PREDICTED: 2-methoxy-6-polyprenyl-1,4-benzoquinol methylase, mitochondrial-like [Ceratosolen solmsi marchali]|uniref:2-methoxy-6-polyprenyl-1,4-benzoquinol methylase, mitochondrial n=1 Tax=Ceratosolen solmsi marchali TaxID=326594 RepID=A0AAJ6VMC5_9HYME|nr:PREDICTED: 2-methoxy-6-polyprenyl-1,4-benzoquinol methylase, mitochondrial-like [Ceratosolen solmsi marchali]